MVSRCWVIKKRGIFGKKLGLDLVGGLGEEAVMHLTPEGSHPNCE